MTNKQTIDGVSRAALELLLGDASDNPSAAWKELRALLDKPAKDYVLINGMYFSHAEILEWREKACVDMEKAAQPQGEVEPVAWIKPDVAKTLTKDECCYAFGSQNPKGTLIPLYAEQPAPVAVVLPGIEFSFEHWWETSGQYCRAGGGDYEKTFGYRAYEAALAEVAKLNGLKP